MTSKYFLRSVPYLAVLSAGPSRRLYRILTREAGDHLVKTLSEFCLNLDVETIAVRGVEASKVKKRRRKYLSELSKKSVSLKRKRVLIIEKGYPTLPILIRVAKEDLKHLSGEWLNVW